MEYDLVTVAETVVFQRKVSKLLTDFERVELLSYLAMHPTAGVVIQGTGGVRKLRWARVGTGKRGGVRVIYYFHDSSMPLYLLTVFGKHEKANISMSERNDLAKLVKDLVNSRSR